MARTTFAKLLWPGEALLLTNLKKFQVKQQQQQQLQANIEVSTHRRIALAKQDDSPSLTNLNNIWLSSPLPRGGRP